MNMILTYNLSPEKEAKLKMLCRKMNLEARTVKKEEYGYPLHFLLEYSAGSQPKEIIDFDDEMLYIAGLRGDFLSLFLNQLRKHDIFIELKAVMTETNLSFSSCELHKELCAEREAIQNGMTFHQK